ncbi:hypothetical protein QJS66_15280 [Kocuria rhizophila]|nr:hypothetical protein QJS66_15280 [Kocuria rhizophila]
MRTREQRWAASARGWPRLRVPTRCSTAWALVAGTALLVRPRASAVATSRRVKSARCGGSSCSRAGGVVHYVLLAMGGLPAAGGSHRHAARRAGRRAFPARWCSTRTIRTSRRHGPETHRPPPA